jgi:MoaA/NifB/PqqE/SkfB family radical SAM enzyme
VLTFQNEPLLDARLEDCIRVARKELGGDWEIEITTNGSLLSRDRIASLIDAGPDVINVSLNAASEPVYRQVMPGLPFQEVQDNVRNLLAAFGRKLVVLRYVKLAVNVREFPRFKRQWQKQGAVVIGYDCNDRLGSVAGYDAIRPPESVLKRVVRLTVRSLLFPVCPFPWSQANILANGDLLMCCHDYTGGTRMGNVMCNGVAKVFNSETYRRVRRDARDRRAEGVAAACAGCVFHRRALWM